MVEVQIDGDYKVRIQKDKNGFLINDLRTDYEIASTSKNTFKIFSQTLIMDVVLVSQNGKELIISVNNRELKVKISDHIDQILEELGLDTIQNQKVKDIKAPMPGSILSILIAKGAEVKEGDHLLVLEAMKMENVIKAPGDGIVSEIQVNQSDSVEKNQVLITFE